MFPLIHNLFNIDMLMFLFQCDIFLKCSEDFPDFLQINIQVECNSEKKIDMEGIFYFKSNI